MELNKYTKKQNLTDAYINISLSWRQTVFVGGIYRFKKR